MDILPNNNDKLTLIKIFGKHPNHKIMLPLLVSKGCVINEGRLALCIENGYFGLVEYLLENNPNLTLSDIEAPIMLTMIYINDATVEMKGKTIEVLLRYGANVNERHRCALGRKLLRGLRGASEI